MSDTLQHNPEGMIGYMIQNLCSIYNGGEYHRNENEPLLKETIDMLNELNHTLDCFWTDEEKTEPIIKTIAKYNSTNGTKLANESLNNWFKRGTKYE